MVLVPALGLTKDSTLIPGRFMGVECGKPGKGLECERYDIVEMDPCIGFDGNQTMCDENRVNVKGLLQPTRIPIRSILMAAGVPSIDIWDGFLQNGAYWPNDPELSTRPNLTTPDTHTMRDSGIEIVLQIEYRNDV